MSGPFPRLDRWQVATAVVVEQMPYGLRVRVPSGEIGVIDRVLIHDLPLSVSEWPVSGDELQVVSGGYTSWGQLRLSSRDSDLEIAKVHQGGDPG